MNPRDVWRTLGIARTSDTGAIRRAYADRLKALDLDREIQAYSELRFARDTALRLARQMPEPDEAPKVDERAGFTPADDPVAEDEAAGIEADPQPSVWPGGAVALPAGTAAHPALTIRLPALDVNLRALTPPVAPSGELRALPLPSQDAFATPIAGRGAGTDPELLVQPHRDHGAALHELLYPDGQESGDPLDPEEERAAGWHLRAVLRDIARGDLSQQERIEAWLAEVLGGAWPRSAPLLAPASAALGWENEAGRLGERPAVRYVNARLKGQRFHDNVRVRGHPLHRAWVELSKPGPAGPFRWFRATPVDVTKLLAGIRQNFPEVEDHLNAERVATWSKPRPTNRRLWVWAVCAIAAIRLVAAIVEPSADRPDPARIDPIAIPVDTAADADNRRLLDISLTRAFGGGVTLAKLTERQPVIAAEIAMLLPPGTAAPAEPAKVAARVSDIVRLHVNAAAVAQGGTDLDRAMELRLVYLRAAHALSPDRCMAFSNTGELDARAALSGMVIVQEQQLATDLFARNLLDSEPRLDAAKAQVPARMVQQVIRDTGLPHRTVSAAFRENGTSADICEVRIALLAAALADRSAERTAILKVL